MLKSTILLIFFVVPSLCLAQLKITGKVINLNDKMPVANASVFLNNASVGNKTADDGSFIINNVRPGQYDLIVSLVGFETRSQHIQVGNNDISVPEISIAPKTYELNEVKIKPDANWDNYYARFNLQFLGSGKNASQCKILNPDMLDLQYNQKKHTLTASSYDFLLIENKALGYTIKYKLNSFSYDDYQGLMYYDGVSVFEDMKGSKSKINKWHRKRQEVFLGSPMHFLRTVIANQLDETGFIVMKLLRKPNPEYKGGPLNNKNKYLQTLIQKSLSTNDFAKRTDKPGLYALGFTDCLYVIYTKKNSARLGDVYHPLTVSDNAASVATLEDHKTYALFDDNGIVANPRSVIFEGDWGTYRMAEMLPVDYEPPVSTK